MTFKLIRSIEHFMEIVPKSQGTIGILRVTTEGDSWHHHRLEIEVEVEGAKANIKDEEA